MRKRRTHEEFVNEIYSLVGNEYTVLGKFINVKTKIEVIHNVCGHKYEVISSNLLKGVKCPLCTKSNRTKTQAQYKREIKSVHGDEYDVIGNYVNSSTKILVKHNICNHEWLVRPDCFLSGTKCPKCSKEKAKKSHNEFVNEVYDLVGNEYEILSEYIKGNKKIKIKHVKCGHCYDVTPANFLKGTRCPKCQKVFRKDTDYFKQEVFNLVNNEYTVLGEYTNCNTKILIRHNICSHEYHVYPSSFLDGKRCKKCASKKHGENISKTHNYFIKEVFNLVGDEFEVLSEYKNNKTKVKFRHNTCNHVFEVTPANFLNGQRCTKCSSSKGERKIAEILQELNINHITQYRFEDCRHIKPLPFDFAVFDKENELLFLIEYDGQQHFEPVKFTNITDEEAIEDLKLTQFRDEIKNTYCNNNEIPLLRIPYWEFDNIVQILHNALFNNNLINNKEHEINGN